MKTTFVRRTLGFGVLMVVGLLASAQPAKTDEVPVAVDKEFLSSADQIKEAAQRGAPTAVWEVLEHAEVVECLDCISYVEPLLFDKDARVREIAAWWMRRRTFGYAEVAVRVRDTLTKDADPARRSYAASALGEFMDPGGTALLVTAVSDSSPLVRAAAVAALQRLNDPAGGPVISKALADGDVTVRRVALEASIRTAGFADTPAVANLLSDVDGVVRAKAADALGVFRAKASTPGLLALAKTDKNEDVRIAAVNAIGEIGDGASRAALDDIALKDMSSRVRDAARIGVMKLALTP
jgi:HEAT repeat protein